MRALGGARRPASASAAAPGTDARSRKRKRRLESRRSGETARWSEVRRRGVALERVGGGPAHAEAGEERRQVDGGTGRPHRSSMAAQTLTKTNAKCI